MNTKKANWLFFVITLSHVSLSLLVAFIPSFQVMAGNMALNILMSEITIWLPTLLFLVVTKTRPTAFCRIKPVHMSTAWMTVLFTMLMNPLITVVNAISMLLVENTVAGLGEQITRLPFWGMLLGIAVYGPFAEELAFRGVIYQSHRQQENRWKALLLGSLLFGLMHMNLNQAGYAFVMGIALSLLVEASGSMIPAFIAHFCVNGLSTALMYVVDNMAGGMSELVETAENSLSGQELLLTISLYLLIATLFTPMAGCVLAWIARREGHEEDLRSLWRSRKVRGTRLMSVPLALGILVCAAVIFMDVFMSLRS